MQVRKALHKFVHRQPEMIRDPLGLAHAQADEARPPAAIAAALTQVGHAGHALI